MLLLEYLCVLTAVAVTTVAAQESISSYAPTIVPCPDDLRIRPARNGLNQQEQEWRVLRLAVVANSLASYLKDANIPHFHAGAYLDQMNFSTAPIAGLAISGGGSTSGLGGLGLWQAFDNRYPPSVEAGTGGLAQCLTYLTGLSGGGITTVLPLASNNFSSLAELRDVTDFTTDYLTGPTGNVTEHFLPIYENMGSKLRAGFPVSIVDVLGQAFAQYLPKAWRYATISDAAGPNQALSEGLGPLPIITLTEVVPGVSPEIGGIMYPDVSSPTLTTYEQTPFEFGSWVGGRVQAFIQTKFLGTSMTKGKPTNSSRCVNGFDQMTFTQGSTGNAWNFWFIDAFYNIPLFWKRDVAASAPSKRQDSKSSIPIPPDQYRNPEVYLVNQTAVKFNQTFNQTLWATVPNPFHDYDSAMTDVSELLLVDGSETSETIPLRPLIVPERRVDFIIAFDASGDGENNWVNGTTFARTLVAAEKLGLAFPELPDATTFVNLELNKYPTFFGCHAPPSTPLVLYIPNAPWSAYSNYTFTQSSFTNHQLDLVFNNTLEMVTYGHGKINKDPQSVPFPACIACGLIYKSLLRLRQEVPEACLACFDRHCWNGTVANEPQNPCYDPSLILEPKLGYEQWNSTVWTA